MFIYLFYLFLYFHVSHFLPYDLYTLIVVMKIFVYTNFNINYSICIYCIVDMCLYWNVHILVLFVCMFSCLSLWSIWFVWINYSNWKYLFIRIVKSIIQYVYNVSLICVQSEMFIFLCYLFVCFHVCHFVPYDLYELVVVTKNICLYEF